MPHAMEHDHTFGQDRRKPGETRTLVVVLLTAGTMIIEIVAGIAYGSMALLADGLHMASHASALAIALFAYVYARRHAHDDRFCFGTGKVNSLAGYTGAVLLAVIAVAMAWESIHRMFEPVPIAFNQALIVAFLGLLVNGLSVVILDVGHADGGHDSHEHGDHHAHEHHEHRHAGGHDHNLRSAYLHVLADALTSMLAIAALLAGKYFGLGWLDPVMGVIGGSWWRGGRSDSRRPLRPSYWITRPPRSCGTPFWQVWRATATELSTCTCGPSLPGRIARLWAWLPRVGILPSTISRCYRRDWESSM